MVHKVFSFTEVIENERTSNKETAETLNDWRYLALCLKDARFLFCL
jgi:hypothetical protein